MSNTKKYMLLGGIILIAIALLLFLIPTVTGKSSVQPAATTTINTKTGREKKIDLSGYNRHVNFEEVKKKKSTISHDNEPVTFSDSVQLYEEFLSMPNIPQLPEPEIYIREQDGTVRKLQNDGNITKATTKAKSTTIRPATTLPETSTTATVVASDPEMSQNQQPVSSLDALSAALAAEKSRVQQRSPEATTGAAISAVIHGEQKLRQGERVKLRTTAAGTLGGVAIPQNAYIYGTVGFGQNRITITISTAFINGRETAITAQVYDFSDGAKGIYMQGITEAGYVTQQATGDVGQEAAGAMAATGIIGRVAGGVIRAVTSSSGETSVTLSNNHKVIVK